MKQDYIPKEEISMPSIPNDEKSELEIKSENIETSDFSPKSCLLKVRIQKPIWPL